MSVLEAAGIVVAGVVAIYLFFRLASAAWYRSKFEARDKFIKTKKEGKDDGEQSE